MPEIKIVPLSIPGCFELQPTVRNDVRGAFTKTFQTAIFREYGLVCEFAEEYFTSSKKGVLRGMHFQNPPHDHVKVVYPVAGRVLDALLDLRVGSPSFGKALTLELDASRANMLYIAKGVAHGFYSLSEQAILFYKVTTAYAPEHDKGIRWDTFGVRWPTQNPLISARDSEFPSFQQFDSPFRFP